tara:strand:- start:196 stop:708 length:513 start_codon:yes stop_codon:yes gene_type:complete
MKLSKKKLNKLYKSKKQSRRKHTKSFKPKNTVMRSRRKAPLNLRKKSLKKMKGGNEHDSKEGGNVLDTEQVEQLSRETENVVNNYTLNTEVNPSDVGDQTEEITKGNENIQVVWKNKQQLTDFTVELATIVANIMTKKYDKKIEVLEEKIEKKADKIEPEQTETTSEIKP